MTTSDVTQQSGLPTGATEANAWAAFTCHGTSWLIAS